MKKIMFVVLMTIVSTNVLAVEGVGLAAEVRSAAEENCETIQVRYGQETKSAAEAKADLDAEAKCARAVRSGEYTYKMYCYYSQVFRSVVNLKVEARAEYECR